LWYECEGVKKSLAEKGKGKVLVIVGAAIERARN